MLRTAIIVEMRTTAATRARPAKTILAGAVMALLMLAGLALPERADAAPSFSYIDTECKKRGDAYRCFFGPFSYEDAEDHALEITGLTWGTGVIPEPGYITTMRATLVDEHGDKVPRHAVHLHHAVWLNPNKPDMTCPDLFGYEADRFFATGKERTKIEMPNGYGYYWDAEPLLGGPRWAMNTHLHWMHGEDYAPDVRIRFDLGFVPESKAAGLTDVVPVWFDIDNCSDSEWDVPGPPGGKRYKATWDYEMPQGGRFIVLGGHLHDGGIKLALRNRTKDKNIYVSEAVYRTKRPRMSNWDLREMTVYARASGKRVDEGDELRLTAVYDNKREWPEVMGIMIGAMVPDP